VPLRIRRQFAEDWVISELVAFRIKNAAQIQAVGRGGDAGQGALLDVQQFPCPVDRLLAGPDRDQGAGDIADHVVQKRIRGDVHDHPVALAVHLDEMHLPKRALGLAALGAERGKIVVADQVLRGLMHKVCVQRRMAPGRLRRGQRRFDRPVQDDVAVEARDRAVARVKVADRRFGPEDAHAVGQVGVAAHDPGIRFPFGGRIEMHDLFDRMHAGVGPACTNHGDRFIRDFRQRLLQRGLYTAPFGLELPAAKAAAVVFDAERDAQMPSPEGEGWVRGN